MSESGGQAVLPRPRNRTRWDIQGLRAFAVSSVVLYHLWPDRLSGGFVGVDVFFVISGYLITSHLLKEVQRHGRIPLASFWTKRAKRLLPASFLTLIVTGVAVIAVVPASLWEQYARELIASTIYLQNWQLASDSVDYLASSNQPSPLQHFWSLSVEEQFYIALPLVLVLLLGLRRWNFLTRMRLMLTIVVVVSLMWSIVETSTAEGVAYFSTATRAWEFALGGLVSTFVVSARMASAAVVRRRMIAAWIGAALLLVSVLVISPEMPFPGFIAILPVAGATLVVLFGDRSGLDIIGRVGPIAFLGRISYAVYLWHWPAIILLPFLTQHELNLYEKLGILLFSVALATLTTLRFEEPLRFSSFVRTMRPRRVVAWGAAATVFVVLIGFGTLGGVEFQKAQAKEFADAVAGGNLPCFGAAADISAPAPCVNPQLAGVRVPAVANAVEDDANLSECWAEGTSDFNHCRVGPRTGYAKHLVALGDSHNNVLLGAYRAIAERYNWRIDVAGHAGCYWTEATQSAPSQMLVDDCTAWKAQATTFVESQTDLSAVVVTNSTSNSPVVPPAGTTVEEAVVSGLTGAWETALQKGVPVIAIRDNPRATPNILECVGRMDGITTAACDAPREAALSDFDGLYAAMQQTSFGGLIDLTQYYCTQTTCPAVIGGVLVYRDQTHLTATFAKTLAPILGPQLEAQLAALGR